MKWLATALSCLLFVACAQSGESVSDTGRSDGDGTHCDDRDGDGFGEGCSQGGDCDDLDKSIHTGCTRCQYPQEGCGCTAADQPVSCYLTPSEGDEGRIMCHEGTRYCRGGLWSACETVVSYPRPDAVDGGSTVDQGAIINPTAPRRTCTDCSVNCYLVRDNLDPTDAGLGGTSSNISSDGGGLTLKYTVQDAGTPDSGPIFNPSKCVLGQEPDKDCDGILDKYDPYPLQKPFATRNPALFLDVAPGETGTGVVNLQFYLNSADVYFLLDQSSTMQNEAERLKTDIVQGNFISDTTYRCADYDFDGVANDELKTQGLMGAIRCMIRDANFGVGYFREIPFNNYGDNDSVTFRNVQNITSDINKVTAAVGTLQIIGNQDRPEAGSLALNALVTGNGFYFGTDRTGVAPRSNCPANTFGAPCFRDKAIPIVLMFTDDPTHQGTTTYSRLYGNQTVTTGTTAGYTMVDQTIETYASAKDLTDVRNTFTSYMGTTAGMKADFIASTTACSTSDGKGPDAVFKFTVSGTSAKTINATTFGSDFDTTLSIFSSVPTAPTALPAYPNTNDVEGNAYSFGDITSKYVSASGNSSTLSADYATNAVACGATVDGKDATFTFTIPSASGTTRVAVDTTGSSFGTTLALFSYDSFTTSYTTIASNDNTYSIGPVYAKNLGYTADTSNAAVTAKHIPEQLNCSNAPAAAAPDADYSFSLASPAHVRISTEGSTLNNVVSLLKNFTAVTSDNTNELAPLDVGVLDDKVLQYTGNTASMASNYDATATGCGSGSTPDAAFKFTLNTPRTVTLDTNGSSFDTVLSLFPSVDASRADYDTSSSALSLGTVNGNTLVTSGATTDSRDINDNYDDGDVGGTACGATYQASASPDAVFRFRVDTATNVRIATIASSFDSIVSLYTGTPIKNTKRKACGFDSAANTAHVDVMSLAAGDYYVVVKGTSSAAKGTFTLSITDLSVGLQTCNNDYSTTRKTSILTKSLAAGSYYVVVRGNATGTPTSGAYVLNLQDTSAMTCDYGSGPSSSSVVEADLAAGTHRIIVKGKAATDKGVYKLAIKARSCDHTSGSAGASRIEANLSPGTYTVLLKGDSAGSAGDYKLSIRDMTRVSINDTAVVCDDNVSGGTTSSISQSLNPGTYYAVVKGRTASDSGPFQLNIGGGGTTTTTFVPPTWDETVAALKSKNVRVIPILSCKNSNGTDADSFCGETRSQYTDLAKATGAVGTNSAALVYDIVNDGSGLSSTVVKGVGALAQYLEMNVSARVVFAPDPNPTPGFVVQVKAIEDPNDRCDGILNDEHQHCMPGATPRFNILFTNPPSPGQVKLNPNDPKGGYNFRVELIADKQFVVDQVPVYIMPVDVMSPTAPVPKVASSGTYWQDVSSANCTGNLLPDWHDLTWDSKVPDGTSVSFSVCTSDKAIATGCAQTPLCTITGGAACTTDSMCGNGFCSTDGNCQTITGKSCATTMDCTMGSTCKSSRCTFSGQPVYVGEALATGNYTANLRMFIGLTGNTTANTGPTVRNWSLSYVCNSAL